MLRTSGFDHTGAVSAGQRFAVVAVAALLGAFIVYGVGLAPAAALHDAAHDTRHALTFPCH